VSGVEALSRQLPDLAAAAGRRAQKGIIRRHVLTYAGLLPFLVIAVFPVYWMAITAFKTDADLVNPAVFPFWFHQGPTLQHFAYLFQHTYYTNWIYNTAAIATWSATGVAVMQHRDRPGSHAL